MVYLYYNTLNQEGPKNIWRFKYIFINILFNYQVHRLFLIITKTIMLLRVQQSLKEQELVKGSALTSKIRHREGQKETAARQRSERRRERDKG